MKFPIEIIVKAGAKENKVIEDEVLIVYVKEKAENNKANLSVIKLLRKYFGKEIYIKRGLRSKKKIIDSKF